MPDLTIHTTLTCASNEHWSRTVKGKTGTYKVQYGPVPNGPVQNDYTCNCPSFTFRGVPCKHIKAVRSQHCQWNSELELVGQQMSDNCPSCNGPLVPIRVGV